MLGDAKEDITESAVPADSKCIRPSPHRTQPGGAHQRCGRDRGPLWNVTLQPEAILQQCVLAFRCSASIVPNGICAERGRSRGRAPVPGPGSPTRKKMGRMSKQQETSQTSHTALPRPHPTQQPDGRTSLCGLLCAVSVRNHNHRSDKPPPAPPASPTSADLSMTLPETKVACVCASACLATWPQCSCPGKGTCCTDLSPQLWFRRPCSSAIERKHRDSRRRSRGARRVLRVEDATFSLYCLASAMADTVCQRADAKGRFGE